MSADLKPSGSAGSATKVVVVFGLDDHDKPRAARFADPKLDLISKAAQLMDLKVCEVTSPDLAEVAKKLPVGRLYANGRGFVPYIRRELYAKLTGLATGDQSTGTTAPIQIAHGLPRTWPEIAIGHLVIAQASLQYGWWEAIVVDRLGDMLTLRWRDYPKEQKFSRHCDAVALMRPPTINQAVA